MTTGQRIKQRRLQIGLSLNDFADRLGKDRSTVYRYETDKIDNMPITVLEPIAEVLHASPAYLMGWSEEPDIPNHERTIYTPPKRYKSTPYGDRIDLVMAIKGFGLQKMADEIGDEMTPGAFAKILDGEAMPDADILRRIANILGVNYEWLAGLTDDVVFASLWSNPLVTAYEKASKPTQENICKLLDIQHVNPNKDVAPDAIIVAHPVMKRILLESKKRGMSHTRVEEGIGVRKGTIAKWIKGVSTPSDEDIKIIAEFLDTTEAYLLGETDDPSPADQEDLDDLQWAALDGMVEPTNDQKREMLRIIRDHKDGKLKH